MRDNRSIFSGEASHKLAAGSLIRKLLTDKTEDDSAINQLIENSRLEVLRDAVGIIRDALLNLQSKTEELVTTAYNAFPTIEKKTVYDTLIIYFNMIKNNPKQQFVPEVIEFQDEGNLKKLNELANALLLMNTETEKYSSILHRINNKIEDAALQESLNPSSNSWCNVL